MSKCDDVAQECVREELHEKNEALKKTVAMMGTDVTRWSTECEQLEARLERVEEDTKRRVQSALMQKEELSRELNLVAGRERRLQADFDQLKAKLEGITMAHATIKEKAAEIALQVQMLERKRGAA